MSRIVSAWLPRWPILRFLAAQAYDSKLRDALSREQPIDPERPFVLAAEASGGPRISATNEPAEALRISIGDGVSDARAKAQFLQVEAADPKSDAVALEHLALWATRYTPSVAPFDEENGADGFFLDITGVASLFGGEDKLLADLSHRLERFGLSPRLAVADTPGMAWALSRFHPSRRFILPSADVNAPENTRLAVKTLADLPIGALRLAPATRRTLRRLGFKRIGALIDAPRAPFAARFEAELLKRLDQALGHVPEPLVLLAPAPIYRKIIRLIEPVFTQDAILALAKRLMTGLVFSLGHDGVGARQLRLTLYRVDGEVFGLDLGLAMPTRDVEHVARLIALKLERLGSQEAMPSCAKAARSGKGRWFPSATRKAGKALPEAIDAGFGFESVGLEITFAERMDPRQSGLAGFSEDSDRAARCAALIDGLRQRLGPRSVRRLEPFESHLPEKAETSQAEIYRRRTDAPASSTSSLTSSWARPASASLRPPLLLRRAEPAQVLALMPEGAPRRFRWRGETHAVALAQGPERIAAEWWRKREPQPTRDYYLVEDEEGRRFWLFREGLYGRETPSPCWFVHGFFA
ncbi:MAG: DNA polymerase Y family protein [Hyphomicrobiales bacterium]|nr:DNA polymerase Y family protein [Hyphomicrobiales bacterium]